MTDVDAAFGDFPLRRHLGMTLEGGDEGVGIARLTAGDEHMNPNGVVHGAVLFALIDTAMGMATMSTLPEGRFCASVDVQLRFIRAARAGELVATTAVLRRGRHVVHLEGRVEDDDGSLLVTAAGTFAILGE